MAGSFDSHFARNNMMWQCQLSQPDCRCYRVDGYSLLKRLPLHPLIGPRCPLQSVGQWLDSIGLVQYENHLLANGFDNVQFMVSTCRKEFKQSFDLCSCVHCLTRCAPHPPPPPAFELLLRLPAPKRIFTALSVAFFITLVSLSYWISQLHISCTPPLLFFLPSSLPLPTDAM